MGHIKLTAFGRLESADEPFVQSKCRRLTLAPIGTAIANHLSSGGCESSGSRQFQYLKTEATIMRRMSICLLLMIPCLLLGGLIAIPLTADEKEKEQEQEKANYHVILFACEREGNPPRFSHTWATFVKSTQNGAAESGTPSLDETITISWMPASGVIPALFTVTGRNYSLEESLTWARQNNARIAAWGPIPIRQELFDRARDRREVLERGVLAYKMLDAPVRPDRGTNCIHAVTDLVPGPLLDTGLAHGEEATRMVAEHFREYMVRPEFNDATVLDLVGIGWDTIEHRTLESSARQ
jgi:hypothetical protein